MTNQAALDAVWTHFVLNQAPPSLDAMGECAYRGAGDTMCAFGIMIPDDLYHPDMEATGIHSILRVYPAVAVLVEGVSEPLLKALQSAHDNAAEPPGGDTIPFYDGDTDGRDWRLPAVKGSFHTRIRAYLTAVAERHNLRVPAEPTRLAAS